MSAIYQYKSFGQEIKDVDTKSRIVKGRFAAFGMKDSDGDVIVHGAFTKTIAERGPNSTRPRIKHLMNHDVSLPLGVLKSLTETPEGLDYESQIGTHTLGNDFLKMVESGLVTEHSIGFSVVKGVSKKDYYEMQELKLWEGSSLTGWGANEFTPMFGAKSLDQINNRVKALEKFCRNTDASDELIELLLIEIKQLSQLVIEKEKSATDPQEKSNQPEDYSILMKELDQLHNAFN